jgi:NhaA family Na+:H+ antiporter
MPEGMNTKKLIGLGLLAGIGFTMSIFISNLAFPNNTVLIEDSKTSVLIASLMAAILGWIVLKSISGKTEVKQAVP